MGDLLAGLLTGLLASGYPPYDAARLAVSWHGLASDQVARSGGPAVLASDVAHHLSTSWRTLIHRAK
jgi:NAD(P)H-hydrate epimerase